MDALKAAAKPNLGDLELPLIPTRRSAPAETALGRWFLHGGRVDQPPRNLHGHPWYRVLWLTGVDYFSTLGYQPGIALLAAAALSPLSTSILVVVTLLGALPVYCAVARRSFAGQGSIAMLENMLSGWSSKIFVLVLLGFATTDFVITMTLSAADAAQHATENPLLHPFLGGAQLEITIAMLAALALVFLLGFTEAIGVATFVTVPYILLNLVVIVRGAAEIVLHPELVNRWSFDLAAHGDWTMLLIIAGIIFPKLALGLSGFETGVAVMPLIAGEEDDTAARPSGRVRATRTMLTAAALIMSFMLITSSFVTTLLIPPKDYVIGGPAAGRALAHLAHTYLGSFFGTLYDVSTIAILGFAGASAMAGMLNLIPRYLPRFGMAPRWVAYQRPLVLGLFAADVLVTLAFGASVEAQGGAYATGVLVLMLSAAVAVALAFWRESREDSTLFFKSVKLKTLSFYFWIITVVFMFTLVDNIIERPDGVVISSIFIVVILTFSAASRYFRAKELRVERMTFLDERSTHLWQQIIGKKVNLVPLRNAESSARERKRAEIQKYYRIEGPIAFVHVHLLDNRSEFLSNLQLKAEQSNGDFVLDIYGAIAVANSIAYLSELIDPKSLFLGLTRQNLMNQALRYLLWGEGEIGLSVYSILISYWDWTPEDDVRPLIFLMSE